MIDARYVYRDFGLKRIVREAQFLGLERIRVGLVGAEAGQPSPVDGRLTNADVGTINHEGTDDGHIPPRRFLVDPYNDARREMTRLFRSAAGRIVRDTAAHAMDWLGAQLADIPRRYILDDQGDWDRNADATVDKKGFDHPLMWLKGLAQAISHRVVRASGSFFDAGGGEYEHFQYGAE